MIDGYILREDMLEKLNGNLDDFYKRLHDGELNVSKAFSRGLVYGYQSAILDVERAQAAPGEPKKGNWVWYGDGDGATKFVCNECMEIAPAKTKFCPNCGAKMFEVK